MTAAASYEALFGGHLKGLLQWPQFEALWAALRAAPEGWFVRDFKAGGVPRATMPAEDFLRFLDEAEAFLRKRHREEYCGFLYLDDAESPTFIKVFDPRKMGSACGCGGEVKPRWTISRMQPELPEDLAPAEEGGQRAAGGWLTRLLRR